MHSELEYLGMQRTKMDWRAVRGIHDEVVVGSWDQQERFPYEQNILRHMPGADKTCTALEYGCGPGRQVKRMAAIFGQVDGVDISAYNTENARQYCAGLPCKFYTCDGKSIPTADEKYHLVYSVICLGHISSYSIRRSILKEMIRVCKTGGQIVCQFGYNDQPLRCPRYVAYHVNDFSPEDTNGWADTYVSSDDELIKDFESLGLTVLDTWHTNMVGDESHDNWIWICAQK